MHNKTTHYQTSFRVNDLDGDGMKRIKATVYGWVAQKESDHLVKAEKSSFFFRCRWANLYNTRSSIVTDSFLADTGDAWALRYTEIDKELGRKRFWISDIGLKKDAGTVVVSVRISYARNTEDLSHDHQVPSPTVPKVVRYILRGNHVFSGRPEFKLLETPLQFLEPGMGKSLCDFIQSPERRYPLLVFNNNSPDHVSEANKLARELAGKCLVAIIASNTDLAEEIRPFLPPDYRIPFSQFRVFFPFDARKNSPTRHRWYNIQSDEYAAQRHGIVNGLLRNHSLIESGAVEDADEIRRLIAREDLKKLKVESPDQQRLLDEFWNEHEKVVADRDLFRQESATFASEIDRLEGEVKQLEWRCKEYQRQADEGRDRVKIEASELLPTLPTTLVEVAELAAKIFHNLTITTRALESAQDYSECKSIIEAWEMLHHLNTTLHRLKFSEEQTDLERTFKNETGYELGMSEGRNTKRDNKLMNLRILRFKDREYDITPHLKHMNNEPKAVRIYFAFDEEDKKFIVGHIGRHIPNATTKTM